MNILFTGGTGHIGRQILSKLCEEGHIISLVVREKTNFNKIDQLKNKINFIDVNEILSNISTLKKYKFDIIIHAGTSYGRKNESTHDMFSINLYLPIILLEFAKSNKVKFFMNFDTILPRKKNLYTLLKNQFIDWAHFYSSFNSFTFINLRMDYVYGPNDCRSKFATWVTHSLINNVQVLKLRKGKQLKNFVYIEDMVDAFITVFNNLKKFKKKFVQIDISTGIETSIEEFVKKIHLYTKSKTKLKFVSSPCKTHEETILTPDPYIIFDLGWEPKNNIESGILKLIKSVKDIND